MPIKVVECLSWPAKDKPGSLLSFASGFEARKVNLEALYAYSAGGGGRIAAVGKNPGALRAALRGMGVKAKVCRGFHLTGKDKAGALVDSLHKLSVAGVNVECADALAAQGKYAATLWVADKDFAKAKRLLDA